MAAVQEKNVPGVSQERFTRQPEDKETEEARPESPTEPTGARDLGEKTQDVFQPPSKLDPAHSFPAPGNEAQGIYTNWQFILVFVVSLIRILYNLVNSRRGTNHCHQVNFVGLQCVFSRNGQ